MSADNGIYIGHFADGEIRVIHAQAIGNLWYPDGENAEAVVDYFNHHMRQQYSFNNSIEAQECAFDMEDEILNSDFPILEYGISSVYFLKSLKDYEQMVNGPAHDGPEVEIIRRENQIDYDEHIEQLKQKHRGFPKGD